MKIVDIRRKIIINSSLLVCLLAAFGAAITYTLHQNESDIRNIGNVKSGAQQIRSQTSELKIKSLEIKKYTTLWKEIPENKKSLTGIKISDINSLLAEVADKYNIKESTIKVNLPEAIQSGIFNCKTITTNFTTASLTFSSFDDTRALMFLSEFFNKIPGYKVTTTMSITKTKDYIPSDFVDISVGKPNTAIRGKIDFIWFSHKEKDEAVDASKPSKPTAGNGSGNAQQNNPNAGTN